MIGRHGRVSAEQARRIAHETLGKVAAGEDPAEGRTRSRSVPTLREAFEEFLSVGPARKESTLGTYRRTVHMDLAPWLDRSLNTISRKDVEQCFNRLTSEIGWVGANAALTMLGALYRRQCVDVPGLPNPVAQWRAAGGRLHRQRRRRIAPPAEVLPCWHRGIERGVRSAVARDALRCGLYTGMRISEVIGLRWERIDLGAMTFMVEETKTGGPLELPVTRQLAAVLERRLAERGRFPEHGRGWVFPSETSASGRIVALQQLNARIGEEGGAKFWFHALRNCFITVADRELMLPTSLTRRLVNHARPRDVTEGYAADWTMAQLREASQRIADRIDELIEAGAGLKAHVLPHEFEDVLDG